MDTSKEYIKMCRQSEEIQKSYEGNGKIGDFVFNWAGRGNIVIREWEDLKTHQNTWLPRQDQLQEMMSKSYGNCTWYGVLDVLIDYYQTGEYKNINSMEQLWLAFVMAEKYQKHWNGRDWVKREE